MSILLPHDHPPSIIRAEDEPVSPGPRSRPGGAGDPHLAEERGEQDLHLVERKRHPQADPVSAPEGEPLVRAELPLLEPFRAEAIRLRVELFTTVDQVGAWAEDHSGRKLPAA